MIIFVGVLMILLALLVAVFRGHLPRSYWLLLLTGAAIGMVWELGFTFSEMGYPIAPGGAPAQDAADLADLPIAAILPILLVVSIGDAGLFVAGLVIARMVLGSRIEREFCWSAFLVMQLWGQLQSLFIETRAIENGLWAYAPSPLNPGLFGWGEAQITLLPQLVWLIGYVVFYAAVLKISRQGFVQAPPAAA